MDASNINFGQAVRAALLYRTAPISMGRALEVDMVGDMIAGVVGKVIDRAWPDPTEKAKAAIVIEEMRQAGEFKAIDAALAQAQMQADVNKVEAASTDRFVAGWRPFIGWVCGSALAWHYIGRPLAGWLLLIAGQPANIPAVELGDLIIILLGMLGLGGLRTTEKLKGAA
jgi:hypothetical protein